MVDSNTLKRNAFVWQYKARQLLFAGNLLLSAFEGTLGVSLGARRSFVPDAGDVWRTMMMLYGPAAENLVKAIIIARGADPAPAGRLEAWFKSHDLTKLASRARLSFAPDAELLVKLSDFIEVGKYPVGKDATSGLRSKMLSHPDDIDLVFTLLERLENELRSVLPTKTLPKENLRHLGRG